MASAAKRVPGGLVFALAGTVTLGLLASAAPPKPPGADAVRSLEATYREERAAADRAGLAKVFSPEWFDRADALRAGRLLEAREAFRNARWQLPAPPPGAPPNLVRVFGDARLRHTSWVW